MATTPDGDPVSEPGTARRSPRTRAFIQSYGDGRTCGAEGCTTTLSRYNRETLCWKHAERRRNSEHRGGHGAA